MQTLRAEKAYYKWVVLVLCFLTVFGGLGFCSTAKSIFLTPITNALGISRSAFSVNDSIRFLTSAVASFFFGSLVARFGTKKLMLAGFVCLMCSMFLNMVATQIWQFYIAGFFLGLGLSWLSTTMIGSIVVRWFPSKTGTLMGLIMGANGLGSAVATSLFSPLVYAEDDPFGYRKAYFWILMALITITLLILLFYKDKGEFGVKPKVEKKKGTHLSILGADFATVKKSPKFYLFLLAIFFYCGTVEGVFCIGAAYMQDMQYTTETVAAAVSLLSVCLMFAKPLLGVIYDKFGMLFSIVFSAAAGTMALMVMLCMNSVFPLLTSIYAVCLALSLPFTTALIPLFVKSVFGLNAYNQMLGFAVSASMLGYAVYIPAMNVFFDVSGSYTMGIYVALGSMITAFILFVLIQKLTKKE